MTRAELAVKINETERKGLTLSGQMQVPDGHVETSPVEKPEAQIVENAPAKEEP